MSDDEDRAKKLANTLRSNDGQPGTYTSDLVAGGWDKPEPVVLMGEEDGGWWFYLPESWPSDFRGDTRWFSQDHGAFRSDREEQPNE